MFNPLVIVGLLILVVALLAMIGYGLTLPIRHILRNHRERRIGGLVWFQIKPESMISGRARRTPEEQVGNVAGFMSGLQEQFHFRRGTISVIWHYGEDDLLRLYVGIDEAHRATMMGGLDSLAHGMNCRAEYVDGPPTIPTKSPVFAFREVGTPANIMKEPESLGNVASELSRLGIPGAVIFTMEDMKPSESRRTEAFIASSGVVSRDFAHAGAQANIVSSSAIRASIAAVSFDGRPGMSESLLKSAFGMMNTSAVKITAHSPYSKYLMYSIFASVTYTLFVGLVTFLGLAPLYIGIPFLVPGVLVLVASLIGHPLMGRKWIEERLVKGEVVIPPYQFFNHRAFIDRIKDMGQWGVRKAPSRRQVIPLYGAPLAQIMSFPDGDATLNIEAEVVPQIGVPSNLDLSGRNDYVLFGFTGENQPIGILHSDIEHCLYIAGAPNSGKSNLLYIAYAEIARMRAEQTGLQITPIWIETKGSGSYDIWEMTRCANDRSIFIDAHNPSSHFRLALEGRRLSEGASVAEVLDNVRSLVSGLQFAYGDGIAASSREALDFSIRIAMLLTEEEIEYLEVSHEVNASRPNVIRLASLIVGGDSYYKLGPKLLKLREDILVRADKGQQPTDREQALSRSIGTMSDYFNEKRDTSARSAPPANKLSALGNLETLWTPDHRHDVYVNQLPGHFAPIILNMGPYRTDNGSYSSTSQTDAQKALLAFNHMLWRYAQAWCSGWQEQGKRVILFSDEMKDIAVDSDNSDADNVVASISKEGRSRGFSIWCASQSPQQVPDSVRSELFGFRTHVWFGLPNKEAASAAIRQMPRNTYFAEENIQKLPMGLAVVGEMRQGNQFSAPFTLTVPYSRTWLEYLDGSATLDQAASEFIERELPQVREAMNRRTAIQS